MIEEMPRSGPESITRARAWPSLAAVGMLALSIFAFQTAGSHADRGQGVVACVSGPQATSPIAQKTVESVAIDTTSSTASVTLHAMYEEAAKRVVTRAMTEKAGLRVVAFGASGVGATVVFDGSFASTSDDELLNLAAANREKCLALQAVERAVEMPPSPLGGSDVAGTIAAEVAAARQIVKPGGAVTVTVLSDGCQAPSRSGPNRRLTDVCAKLAHGRSIQAIVGTHAAEFGFDARGVTVVMEGVGVGRNPAAANTLLARKLVAFWDAVCRRARAKACRIGSAVL